MLLKDKDDLFVHLQMFFFIPLEEFKLGASAEADTGSNV
jgi:hypothetical protein